MTIALRILVCALVALLTPSALAQDSATPESPPPVPRTSAQVPKGRVLDQGWEYRTDQRNEGLSQGWSGGQRDVPWTPVEIPHVFDPRPTDNEFTGQIGWYRVRFQAPPVPAGFGWRLRFEGVRRVARAWLNGRPIGHNGNPYEPFSLPATGLRPGMNELVLRVHNIKPLSVREGWWNWGGIVRPVHLEPVGPVSWDDVGLLSDVSCERGCRALVRADGWLVNRTSAAQDPQLTVYLRSPAGEVSTKTVTVHRLAPGERRRVTFPMRIVGRAEESLWSPKHPWLYNGFIQVRGGSEIFQHDERRTGLRYIRVQDGHLFLNGHRLRLRGASIQEDLPGRGPALRPPDNAQIVSDLRSLNADVTRAQYPLNDDLLARLDAAGILVWSQAPVYHEDRQLATPAGRRNAMRKLRGSILYARNHPSVMTHSVANELAPEADVHPGTRAFLEEAARAARDLDSTVPVSLDLLSYPSIPRQRVYTGYGLLGINSYYGWYKGKPGKRSTAKLSSLAPYLAAMRRKYPAQAMMITEFGAEATYDGPANVKQTFQFQSRYVAKTLDVVDRMNWLSGAIYWTAREFYVKPNWNGGAGPVGGAHDSIHNKGLISYDGQPKPAARVAAARFKATDVYDDRIGRGASRSR